MTKDEVIALAFQAQIFLHHEGEMDVVGRTEILRFAELVAAKEREECAKLVDPSHEHRKDASWGYLGGEEGVELLDSIAAEIRARGKV